MRLHLPTRLRAAVLACFAVVTSFTTTLATGAIAGGAFAITLAAVAAPQAAGLTVTQTDTPISFSTDQNYSHGGIAYDAATGKLTGAVTSDISFDLNLNNISEAVNLIRVGAEGDGAVTTWGLWVMADKGITGMWQNGAWTNGGTVGADLLTSEALDPEQDGIIRLSAHVSNSGVALNAGDSVSFDNSDKTAATTTDAGYLYNRSSLKSSTQYAGTVIINNKLITNLHIIDRTTTYTADGHSISLTEWNHANYTGAETQYTATTDTEDNFSQLTNHKPLFIGGSGRLILKNKDGWGNSRPISLDNDIYLGSSTHTSAATYGVLDFMNEAATTISGKIFVVEDTFVCARNESPINLQGEITDKFYIDNTASTGGKTLRIGGRGYALSGRVDVSNIVLVAGSGVNFSGEVAVGDLTMNGNASASFGGSSASLSGLHTAAESVLTVNTGGSLTLGGTVELGSAIVNNGTLAFANDVQLDLSGLTAADGVYTLFTGNEVAGFGDLNVDNITGINTVGYDWVFNANGTITGTLNSEAYVYSGGTLSWDTSSASFDGNKTFANNGVVVFKGNSTVSLAENITASSVMIEEGVSVALSGSGNNLTATELQLDGTLVLNDNALNAASRVTGAGNLHIGGEVIISDRATLSGFTNTITVLSGGVLKANGNANRNAGIFGSIYGATGAPVIVVENGGMVDINGKADIYYKVILKEGATYANTSSTGIGEGSRQLPVLVLEGDATITANAELGMRASSGATGVPVLTLNGHTLTKNGPGTFFLHNTTADAGTIRVETGTLSIRSGGTYTNTNIDVEAGATLSTTGATLNGTVTVGNGASFTANSGTYTGTSVTLEEGGTLVYRTGANSTFKAFNTTGAATFDAADNRSYSMTVTDASIIGGRLTKTNLGGLIWSNSVTLAGGIDIQQGTVTFNGAATVSGTLTVASGATLNVGESGSVIVGNLGGFAVTTTEPEQNGLASVNYRILDNSGTSNITSVTYNGTTHTLTDGNLSLSDLYYVVSDTVTAGGSSATADTDRATCFVVKNGAVLDIQGNAGSALNVHKIVTTTSGSGTMVLRSSTTLKDGDATVFAGDLEIASGTQLSLGANSTGGQTTAQTASISSLNSVVLNGGTLFVRGVEGNLGSIVSKESSTGSVLQIYDMDGANGVPSGTISLEKLELNADMSLHCNWKSNIDIALLTGSGNLDAQHYFRAADGGRVDCGDTVNLDISSLNGYTGAISMIGGDKGLGAGVNMDIATGASGVSMKGISISNSTLNLAVQGTSSMSEGLKLIGEDFNGVRGSTATIAIAPGAAFSGPVIVEGPGNTLTSSQGGMNLSQLNVAEGAALGLNGAVSALLMNQAGTVDIADMMLTDGAVLTYGNAANLLSVTDGMLAGNVVIGTGLVLTEAGVNLGLSSAIAQEKIGISNYANSALLVVGDTWHLKGLFERYYWEGEDNDFFADPNKSAWSTTDNDKSNLVQLPAALDNVVLVFSDEGTEASPNTMKLNGDKTVHSVEVSNGYYEFANAGKITCTELNLLTNGHLLLNKPMTVDQLSMAANSSLSINGALTIAEGGKVTVTGAGAAIELGTGRTLTADALDISIDGASLSLSGTGTAGTTNSVTVSSISLGADSGLELAAGTSNLTLTANSITHDVGSSISIGAGQVLDVSAYNYGNKGSQWAALLKAVSGAGTLILKADNTGGINAVIQPGEAVTIATNVEMSQLKLNYIGLAEAEKDERTLTIGSNGSLKVGGTPDADAVPTITDDSGADGVLICESGATVKVEGGRLSAEHIMLGHNDEDHEGDLWMTSAAGGSITTGSITLNNSNDDECTFTMEGGTLTITSTAGIGAGVVTDITGGTLVASHADGWGVTGASVGGAAVAADSTGAVTLTNATVTGDITGNGKLVLAGTVNATAGATVSGASVGGITVTTADGVTLTLNNTTIGSTITNNGTLEFSGTQNVTLAASSVDKYYDSGIYGDNGYKSTEDVYTLVSGTAASAAADTIWQVNGAALSGTHEFDGNTLTHITADTAGKVYYINSGSVVYEDGAGCKEAVQLQLTGGTLVMSQELNSTVTTGGIAVTGSSTTLELNAELDAENVSMGTGAATVLMGNGTLNLGTGTVLASGISLGTETDAEWTGTVKVTGAELSDANLSALGVTGSVIELNDTDGTLTGGTYTADVKLTNGSEVVLGANNSFASLDAVDGSLSIAGAGNSIVTLTMANDATLELDLNTAEVSDLKKWSDGPMLTVTTLDTATAGGKLSISALLSDEALLTLGNGDKKVLATINTCGAELDLLVNGSPAPELTDPNDGMQYKYTLVQQEGTDAVDIVISAENARRGWIAADSTLDSTADTTWANDDTADGVKWSGAVGEFYGEGYKTVTVEEGGVSADHVIVSANGDDAEYTFTGGEVSTTRLTVNKGELVIDNAGVTAEELVILAGEGKITLNAGKTLTVGKTSTENPDDSTPESGMTVGTGMLIGGTAELDNSGTVTVNGTLSISETAKVTNSGTLYAASLDASGAEITNTGTLRTGGGVIGTLSGEGALNNSGTLYIESDTVLGTLTNSGTLRVDGDLTVNSAVTEGGTVVAGNVTVDGAASFTSVTADTLKADEVTLTNGSISTLETSNLTVNTTGTVTVDNAVTLKQLSGDGLLEAKTQLTLDGAVAGTADVNTPELVLTSAGSSLGAVKADGITMAEDTTLSTEEAFLTVGSIASLSGEPVYVVVSESAFDAFAKQTDGVYTAADYLLVDGAASAEQFTYAQDGQLLSILQTGMDAGLTVKDGVLALSISEITNAAGEVVGMVWDTTEGNTTTNNGVEITQGEGFYKALDYVQQVLVTEERTFDLSDESVGDSVAGNASDPVAGLLIRNLSGGGGLTVKGNSASQDAATLMNTPGRAVDAVALTADAATVNLGLPEDAEGYLVGDQSSTGPVLKSLSLVNRAAVNVNSNTEVLGITDVADHTVLAVADGMQLTTGMLKGTDEARIRGTFEVTRGGVYTGAYEDAFIMIARGSELHLRMGGRRDLGLRAEHGSIVSLWSFGMDGRMNYLRVGSTPLTRALGGDAPLLDILNATVSGDTITHSTLTVDEKLGNYINGAVVQISLGAAETAATALSRTGVPVVFDGDVDVLNSEIRVNMMGNTVKDGVLNIDTSADTDLTLARFVTGGLVSGNTVTLTGTPEMLALLSKYYTNARMDDTGRIKVDRVRTYYADRLEVSGNAQVGIDMADAALVKLNPQANRTDCQHLAGVLDALDAAVAAGDSAAAETLGAAVSGASVAALGAAVAGDVERQLMGIRNRTTTMGVDQTQVNENMPYFNAWINAEGDFRRVDADGTASGYELSSWGGTVGFDVDCTPRLTLGLAATAMYGDFTAKSADKAEGDLDTYYVTAFARYASNRWSHTFVATVGMADTSLKRTVSPVGYTAEGDSEATTFGFLYELGYVAAMNESATACLQPVFNVMLTHSSLDGCTEEGTDAALRTGGVDMTTVTFGMGARVQAIVGTNLYNRSSMVEARALLKLRTGDREAESENELAAVPGAGGTVTAAELSTIGAEIGVGITIPMGADGGSVFADASLEVGSGSTNINGTVGYRINF